MDRVDFQGVDLAELLPRIPDSIKNGLPFGLVKLDPTGRILEYNMTEGQISGVDPKWAVGRNFFDEVAVCTKTAAFYGRFVEGVRKGFVNAVFDYTFDHRQEAMRVRVHMVSVPDHLGRINIMILVKRSERPVVADAQPAVTLPVGDIARDVAPMPQVVPPAMPATPASSITPMATAAGPQAAPSIEDIVRAVVAVLNQVGYVPPGAPARPVATPAAQAAPAAPAAPAPTAAPAPARAAAQPPATGSQHEDIIKF
jgi:photoactive yellow protein